MFCLSANTITWPIKETQLDRFEELVSKIYDIIPYGPVRDQRDYRKKMERYFPIKQGKPRLEWLLPVFAPFSNFLHEGNLCTEEKYGNELVCQNGTANFSRTGPTGQSGLTICRGGTWNRNGPFDRDFPNFWHNVRTPNLSVHYDSSCYANTLR